MAYWVLRTIRNLRLEKNYSQEYVSSKLNMSQSFYGRIENGKAELNIKTLHKILKVLEIDYLDFYNKIKLLESKNGEKQIKQ